MAEKSIRERSSFLATEHLTNRRAKLIKRLLSKVPSNVLGSYMEHQEGSCDEQTACKKFHRT